MTVGIALVTHPGVGTALRSIAEQLLGRLPLGLECVEVPFDSDPNLLLPAASAALRRLDQGQGVLMLCDLYGASPSNFAQRMAGVGVTVRRVAGLNLPMLLRAMNYADRDLDQLAETAAAGGKLGVIIDHA